MRYSSMVEKNKNLEDAIAKAQSELKELLELMQTLAEKMGRWVKPNTLARAPCINWRRFVMG